MTNISALLDTLDLEEIGADRYRAGHLPQGRGVVLSGELIAKAIVAAARNEPGKEVLSATGIFARGVRRDEPLELGVDRLHSGRAFATSTVHLDQGERHCARLLMLLHAPEPDLIRHGAAMPDVAGPDDVEPWHFSFGGEESRVVGNVDVGKPDQAIDGGFHAWIRCPDAPDDRIVQQALLSFVSGPWLIGTAMLPHEGYGVSMSHTEISTGVMTQSVTFHDGFDVRDWMLLAHESTFAGRGRAYGRNQVFTRDGQHVASVVQDSIVRAFPEGHSTEGRESTVF